MRTERGRANAIKQRNRGVSPVVSYVFMVAMVIVSTMGAYIWAISEIDKMGESGKVQNYINQMTGMDFAIRNAAHGDINFTHTYEIFYGREEFLKLLAANDSITLEFRQGAKIVGYVPSSVAASVTTSCNSTYDYVQDIDTGIVTARESNTSRVFKGAAGAGAGTVEIMICYYDIDLVEGTSCLQGKSGPSSLVYIRKIGVNGTKPKLSIEMC